MISNLSLRRRVKSVKKGIKPLPVRSGDSLKVRHHGLYRAILGVQAALVYAAVSLPSVSNATPAIPLESGKAAVDRICQGAFTLPVELKLLPLVLPIKQEALPLNLHEQPVKRFVAAAQALPVQGEPVRDVRNGNSRQRRNASRNKCDQYLDEVSWTFIHIAFCMCSFTVGYAIMYALISRGIVK